MLEWEDCPPKLGGQHDREAIVRGVVPKPKRFGVETTSRGIRLAIRLPSGLKRAIPTSPIDFFEWRKR